MEYVVTKTEDTLKHHGILGQKWGVRRYQNADGTLTEAGKKRIAKNAAKLGNLQAKVSKRLNKQEKATDKFSRQNNRRILRKESSVKKAAENLSRETAKFSRAINKANRYYRKMQKRYGDTNLSAIDKNLVERGQAYVTATMNNALSNVSMQQLKVS